ncbi:hypothetical protein GA0074692_5010 [Micromonospora pallida]|uniref:Uncharacterized protein n=1 Tax=Micromonospora pallida TaxID=145854 RepID=A0A1C6TAE3_9ACTN|nr:hypothetical protein [Micromonospora pallida]SCL38435.1 hypothetical protein GA0074692_5010 [Micromonospora pallida]
MRFKRPRGLDLVVVLATLASVAILLAALPFTSDGLGAWGAGVLVNIGASVLLVVPVYVLNRRLDNRIERAQDETRSSVNALADRVSGFEKDVERRLEDVAKSVSARLAEEREQDRVAFDGLLEGASRKTFEDALRRAHDLGLIQAKRGPRVCVSRAWDLYVRVDFDDENVVRTNGGWGIGKGELIEFVVERLNGKVLEVVPWPAGEDLREVMVRVGRALERGGSGAEFDVRKLFQGYREALAVAGSHPSRRPVWEVCPPQWVVTPQGIAAYGDGPPFVAPVDELRPVNSLYHVQEIQRNLGNQVIDKKSYFAAKKAALALIGDRLPF